MNLIKHYTILCCVRENFIESFITPGNFKPKLLILVAEMITTLCRATLIMQQDIKSKADCIKNNT